MQALIIKSLRSIALATECNVYQNPDNIITFISINAKMTGVERSASTALLATSAGMFIM
jgi:hypothetical protein